MKTEHSRQSHPLKVPLPKASVVRFSFPMSHFCRGAFRSQKSAPDARNSFISFIPNYCTLNLQVQNLEPQSKPDANEA